MWRVCPRLLSVLSLKLRGKARCRRNTEEVGKRKIPEQNQCHQTQSASVWAPKDPRGSLEGQGSLRHAGKSGLSQALGGSGDLGVWKRRVHSPSNQQPTKASSCQVRNNHCFLLIWLLMTASIDPRPRGGVPSLGGFPSMDPPLTEVPPKDPSPSNFSEALYHTQLSARAAFLMQKPSRPSAPREFHGESCLPRHSLSRDLRHIPKGV